MFTRLTTIVLFASLVLFGCKKEESDSLNPQQEQEAVMFSLESETENELVFNDVFDNVMGVNTEVGVGGTGVFGRNIGTGPGGRELRMDTVLPCVNVTIVPLNLPNRFPLKITIDFGSSGCLGRDGLMRYGKIITVYTGSLRDAGKSATTTFDGFKINNISVEGKHVITNTTGNTPGSNQKQFTVHVTDAKLSKPNGNYSQWNSHRVTTQIEGNGTIHPVDDIFRVTGGATGKVKRGNTLYAWASEITDPLIKKFTCRWISKGIIRVKRESLSNSSVWVSTLNYGNGDCDYKATLTINGVVHNIELPH